MKEEISDIEVKILTEEPFDANEPESVNKRKHKVAREKKEHLNFYAKIMGDAIGRKWLYRVILAGEIYSLNYSPNEDSRAVAFREGKKYISYQLLADARNSSPELFNLMLKEGEQNKLGSIFPQNGLL